MEESQRLLEHDIQSNPFNGINSKVIADNMISISKYIIY